MDKELKRDHDMEQELNKSNKYTPARFLGHQNLFNALIDICGFVALEQDVTEILKAIEQDKQEAILNGWVPFNELKDDFEWQPIKPELSKHLLKCWLKGFEGNSGRADDIMKFLEENNLLHPNIQDK